MGGVGFSQITGVHMTDDARQTSSLSAWHHALQQFTLKRGFLCLGSIDHGSEVKCLAIFAESSAVFT